MDIKPVSMRRRLHRMIIWILLLSLISTAVTWLMMLWAGQSRVNSENYYEQMIPGIEKQIERGGSRILSPAAQPDLDRIVPAEGITYKVVDSEGTYLYGTFADVSPEPADRLLRRLNTVTGGPNHHFVHHIPILDEDHQWRGAVLLYYKLRLTPVRASDSLLVKAGVPLFLSVPFLYIILYTLLLVRRFHREIKDSLDQLMTATRHIRHRDLEFTLTDNGTITEIRELSEAFELMRKELAESLQREWRLQKERREMIAALAHDIRTPLTIIQGHVEGLEEAKTRNADRFENYLKVIKNNVQRAVKLVKDLNQTAVLEQESFQLSKIRFDPVEFMEEKRTEYVTWCRKKKTVFIYGLQDERPPLSRELLHADPDRLSQVLDNLLANSLRFAEQGEIRLEAIVTRQHLEITVADNGPGFEPGKESRVFDAFYQASGGKNRSSGHAGLGLYIAKSIVVKHGGEIWAAQGKSGGAAVCIRIPLELPSEAGLTSATNP